MEVIINLSATILAVTRGVPRILTVANDKTAEDEALPAENLDAEQHLTLELGLRQLVEVQTGLNLAYVEQLYTFGDKNRCSFESKNKRLINIAYLALVREQQPNVHNASWRNIYHYLPWEDWRQGKPKIIDENIIPRLRGWAEKFHASKSIRANERIDITFGLDPIPWNSEKCLDRYELLYEAGLCAESDTLQSSLAQQKPHFGRKMSQDHRRILATTLSRIRGKIKYRPLIFELLSEKFTLLALQKVVESLAGACLHKQNFRRVVERSGLVEGSGEKTSESGGRPAELFRFRKEVQKERSAPGVHFSTGVR